MLKFILCAHILMIFSSQSLASGPPENMGHLLVETREKQVLFDLQVPARLTYSLGLPKDRVFKFGKLDDQSALIIFNNSLGQAHLQTNDESCAWGPYEVLLGPGISRIRSVASCPEVISSMSFEFPFLKTESSEFLIAGTSNFAGAESFEMRPTVWQIRLSKKGSSGILIAACLSFLAFVGLVYLFRKKKLFWKRGAR